VPSVSWYRGQLELIHNRDRVELSEAPEVGAPGSRLTITTAEKTDRAHYTCVATSDQWGSQYNATVFVRVKGNWPIGCQLAH